MARAAARPSFLCVLGLSGALATSSTGCQRKAPGPEECVLFAHVSYGVPSVGRVQSAGLRNQIDELTRECLLTPYDRELIACTLEGGSPRACMRAFSARRGMLPPTSRAR
jgi:hypothetical protein